MKLYVMENGKLVGPKSNSIAGADPSEMQTAPIWSVLIDHPEGLVLLDAGCHTDARRQHPMIYRDFSMRPEDHIVCRLAALGVGTGDISHLVISHLHADHSGFLEMFTNAKVYIHEDELTQRLKLYAQGDAQAGSLGDIAVWLASKPDWAVVARAERVRSVLPGIDIYNMGPGHSFGMLGLFVELPKTGKLLLAGDAVYNRENVGPPVRLAGNMYDADGFVRTIEWAADFAAETGAQLWYGHDEEQFAGLIKSTAGYYE
ncbi:MAG: N-acyl homoserine lactonase family protein [Oscillospiraceae bacterium]|jgi:glyoxylase-like metal-dependent hydrolase (beta-lactamase superfamily II)|nr:N-acyl homoserine lactonase family protein [Oscillospiraceae bacterium]